MASHNHPRSQLSTALDATLDAVQRLLELYKAERILHLAAGSLAFLLLIYAIVLLLGKEKVDATLLGSLFGSAGLITVSAARIVYFFDKAFTLVEDIVRARLKLERKP